MVSGENFGRPDFGERIFAHCPDKCFVRYSPDGKLMYSGGGEGKVYVYPLDRPLSTESTVGVRIHRGAILGLAVHKDVVATCSVDGTLATYGPGPEGLVETKLVYRTSASLPLRCLSIRPDGKYLVTGGDNHEVVLIGLDDVEHDVVKTNEAHKRPVTSIEFDPRGEYIASVDMDGLVVIFSAGKLEKIDQFSVKIGGLSPKYMPKLAWSPDGSILAVSGSDSLKLVQRSNGWTTIRHIPLEETHKETAGLFWSADGSLLVSHDMSTVAFWNPYGSGSQAWNTVRHVNSFYAFCMAPDMRDIAFIDHEGMLVRHPAFLSPDDLAVVKKFRKDNKVKKEKKRMEKTNKSEEKKKKLSDLDALSRKYLDHCKDDGDDDEDGDGDGEDEDEVNSMDEEDEGSEIDLDNTSGGEDGEEEEEDGMDLDLDSLDDYSLNGDQEDHKEGEEANQQIAASLPAVTRQHPPFQPGASVDMKGEHRYLAWNLVGIITSRLDEAGYRSVDIEFHDKLSTRPIRFIDDYGYGLAALSRSAAFFATTSTCSNSEGTALIHYMAFETWGGRQTWTVHLEEDEQALAVAVDEKWSWVATSHGWLRSFSPTGLQQPIITYSGDLVTMTAGAGKLLLITCDQGGSLTGHVYSTNQSTHSLVMTLTAEAPLGRRADRNRLSWAGISESGIVGCFDQTGILYGLADRLAYCWTPIGDVSRMMKDSEDLVWPVFFDRNELTAIICKGEGPAVLPRPIMTTLPLTLPLLQADDAATRLYEPVLRTTILSTLIDATSGLREKDIRRLNSASDKHLLELVQLALKADRPVRVLELCGLFYTEKSFDIAVQLARHNRLISLADRIDLLKDDFIKRKSTVQVIDETPKLPLRIQRESPSVILANLTPGETSGVPSLRAAALEVVEEASPSVNRKRTRLDLVADSADIEALPEEPSEPKTTPFEVEQEAIGCEPTVHVSAQQPIEKKPASLADMLTRLSSLGSATVPSEPAATKKLKPTSAAKENSEQQPQVNPAQQKSLKQASLSAMFSKKPASSLADTTTDQAQAEPDDETQMHE